MTPLKNATRWHDVMVDTVDRDVRHILRWGMFRLGFSTKQTKFTPLSQPVLEKLREVDLNRLTPLEALNLLAELKKEI
jgi:hypothetical protein